MSIAEPPQPATEASSVNGYAVKPVHAFVQLRALRNVKENWDGYGGAATSHDAIRFTEAFLTSLASFEIGCRLLPSAILSPSRTGGVLVEWKQDSNHLEIEIEPNGTAEYLFRDRSTNESIERSCSVTGEIEAGFLEAGLRFFRSASR